MDTSTAPVDATNVTDAPVAAVTTSPSNKGKGKATEAQDTSMEEDEEEEEEEEEDDDDEEEEDDAMEEGGDILPAGARRSTRAANIDYSSAEALQKAGLTKQDLDAEDEEEEDFKMKEGEGEE